MSCLHSKNLYERIEKLQIEIDDLSKKVAFNNSESAKLSVNFFLINPKKEEEVKIFNIEDSLCGNTLIV